MSGPETPADSPLTMAEALASPVYRDLATPRLSVGDTAYEFPAISGDLGRRPIALVFGSYT